jgi:hypothetical protein
MMRAIRGQPNRGLRDLSSTMAWMSASSGPFGPGLFGHGVDRTAVHADSDEATRELVHHHEHPVAPEHDGLASKEVNAPQAVCGVSDERQPRGPGAARGGAIVFRQHAVHNVLVDIDPERVRDDARNPGTAETRIARLELDDGLDECLAWPFRSGLLGARAR